MNIFFYIYEALLLIYSGYRTYDFMSNQLPKGGDNTTNILISIAFLGATELGLILWHFLSRKNANTGVQEQTATIMTWVDFLGSLGAGVADMIIHQTLLEGYELPRFIGYILLYGMPTIVGLNVGAGIIYKTHDAKEMLDRKQKQIEFAKTDLELEIRDQTIKSLQEEKTIIANKIKKDAASVLKREVTDNIAAQFGLDREKYRDGQQASQSEPPKTGPVQANENGHKAEPVNLSSETVAPGKVDGADPIKR